MNYIVGTGLAGLITSYITGIPAIGPKVGGQMSSPFPLGPRILEDCGESRYLLARLGVVQEPREFKIGYIDSHHVIHPEADERYRFAYYKKTRGGDTPSSSCLSGGRSTIVGWDMDEIHLLERLANVVTPINNKVGLIFPFKKVMYIDGVAVDYDNIISTIPLPVLNNLTGHLLDDSKLEAYDTVFVLYEDDVPLDDRFDYIYDIREGKPHRWTRVSMFHTVAEIRGDKYTGTFYDPSKASKPIKKQVLKGAQIKESMKITKLLDIDLIGRYAQWDHSIKTEDVIRRAMKYAEQMGTLGK